MAKVLIDKKSYRVELSKSIMPEVLTLLEQTTLGTRGVHYRHQNIRERVRHLKHPYFLNLYRHNALWGTIAFSSRPMEVDGQPFNAFYIRYFAFRDSVRSSGEKTGKTAKGNTLKVLIEQLFRNGLIQTDYNYGEQLDLPFLFYAYIDDDNLRSLNLSTTYNFKLAGNFNTITFTRMQPKRVKNITKLPIEQRPEFRQVLQRFYRSHQLLDFHDLFRENNYYVLKVNGEIIVGAQVHTCLWEVASFGSKSRDFILKGASRIPAIKKRFNPEKLYFLSIDHIYVNKNYEDALLPFFEGLLTIKGVNMAMIWLDTNDGLGEFLIQSKKLGPLSKIQKVKPANCLVRYSHDFPKGLKQKIKEQTLFLSGYDMT